MKISGTDIFVVDVPYIPAARQEGQDNHPYVVVRVHTDAGLVGLGERWNADKREVEAAAQDLIGKDPLSLSLQSYDWPFQSALYDLAGQALGVPAWRLIGDKCRDRVPVCYWSCRMPPEQTAREAEKAVALGFRVHKLKARAVDIVQQVEMITRAVGPDLAIRVDPNCGFGRLDVAVGLARQLEGYNIECFEDPIPQTDFGWYRLLRQKLDIPQALHLNRSVDVLQAIRLEAVDCLNFSGNVAGVLQCHAIAESAGIPMWHGLAGLSLGIQAAFAVHISCTLKNATMPSDELPFIHENDLTGGALKAESGHYRVPEGPGLGIQLDESALEHYRIG